MTSNDTDMTSDFLIYDTLRNTSNEFIRLCNVKFIDRSVPAMEDNTIYVANVELNPRTEMFDGVIYQSVVNIYVKTKVTEYISASQVLRTILKEIKQVLKENPVLDNRNIRFGRQSFDYGSTYTLKGISLLVYLDEEETFSADIEEVKLKIKKRKGVKYRMTTKKKTSKKPKFNFQEYMENLDLNKYLKIGFLASLDDDPKNLAEAEKLLKEYLGE